MSGEASWRFLSPVSPKQPLLLDPQLLRYVAAQCEEQQKHMLAVARVRLESLGAFAALGRFRKQRRFSGGYAS